MPSAASEPGRVPGSQQTAPGHGPHVRAEHVLCCWPAAVQEASGDPAWQGGSLGGALWRSRFTLWGASTWMCPHPCALAHSGGLGLPAGRWGRLRSRPSLVRPLPSLSRKALYLSGGGPGVEAAGAMWWGASWSVGGRLSHSGAPAFQDLPSFTQNVHRLVNDLRYYRLCNHSLPPGTVKL